MNGEKKQHRNGDVLGHLIAFDEADRALWPVEDMRRMLRMQLGAKLHLEFDRAGMIERSAVQALAEAASPPVRTFADLFHHARPPLELLWAAKDFAKNCRENPHSEMSPEIALAIYYGSIAAALAHRCERITSLDDDELRQGLNWLYKQSWLDDRTRGLIREAMHCLRNGRHMWRKP